MITDLFKNGEYRGYGIVTFFKDYFLMLICLLGVLGIGLLIWSIVLLINAFVIFYNWHWGMVIMRSIFVLAFIPPAIFHNRSHALEKQKYKLK